ncbi:natural resistance-associated macrophage protein [Obba rivulosa]|uniref:Natural resistance-associated macrophage protein n=1 Tax=Obba rivulosa TaxID=1052685 RepID=A0A8E2DVW9_9APHY|nr:natural resistance-associated macrophage protein [Obba rivulosa]
MSLLEHPSPLAALREAERSTTPVTPKRGPWESKISAGWQATVHHLKKHVGVGLICSVAYFDPGNWSVDLQAGSTFGYRPMLFVILMAGLGAIVLQSLAFRLGCVTGLDLATHCRILLHDRPRYRRLIRFCVLYPLYILSEIAIISTDLAELLGSAIGLNLIFPALPLWAAVLLTAGDVLIFLVLGDPSRGQGRPVKFFEYTVIALVFAVFVCFVILLVRVDPSWPHVFFGFVPSKKLFTSKPDALYAAVGILGATVMPHALFLGSFLSTQDRVSPPTALPYPTSASGNAQPSDVWGRLRLWFKSLFAVTRAERNSAARDYRDKYGHENKDLSFIRAHLAHGLVDVVSSLLGVAVPINSAILVIAATVFFDNTAVANSSSAGLFDAHDLIKEKIGKAAAFIFALALLCSGQTASITATLAGQIVSEGFIEWRVSPFLRRIITRLIGLVPSMVVAIAVGRAGINTLLVASQVVLSIVLPFVAFPLIWLTSSKSVMSVRKPPVAAPVDEASRPLEEAVQSEPRESQPSQLLSPKVDELMEEKREDELHEAIEVRSVVDDEYVSFANGRLVTAIAILIFLVILVANVYVLVMLALGRAN